MTESFEYKHLEGVCQLERECFSLPWSKKSLEEMLVNPNAEYLVFCENDTVLGYVGMLSVLDEGYINNIAVKEDCRRRGIAKSLLIRLIELSRQKGLSFIALEVRQSNFAAISLYKALGFTQEGLRRGYYTSPKEDALLMKLILKKGEEED